MKISLVLLALAAMAASLAEAQTTDRYDVVIDEIMADPSPQVGLPVTEWIELKNTSPASINLLGWRIVKGAAPSGAFPNFILQPDSFVIICTGSSLAGLLAFGATISVTNFPSLNNDADLLYLKSGENKTIHAVNYTDAWYGNELKKAGGWTLEMIDTKNPCSGSTNWQAAIDVKGGTPGKINSSDAINTDNTLPKIRRAFATDSLTLSVFFNEPMDSVQSATGSNYNISEGIGSPLSALPLSPLFDRVDLKLGVPLAGKKVYTLTVNAIADCSGNVIGSNETVKAGLASFPDSLAIVINEILFNPSPDGVDYVELYNPSAKVIDLKQLYIANRNSTGVISAIQQVSRESLLLFPGEFIVITEDPAVVQKKYFTNNINAFVQLTLLPSFPDDKGDVIILNAQGLIVDEVMYNSKWHFELLSNTEGISLERIDYNSPSVRSNFHSAATSAGYGTPGFKNSQFAASEPLPGEVAVTPAIFSPDNDGNDDFATLNYSFTSPGFVANITIFDASGRPVRYFQRNALCGRKGNFRWDGLGEKQQKLPQGIYIFFTEVFNVSGQKKQYKNTIVLARRS